MKNHDPLCYVAKNGGNCCPWMPECDCQCMCDYINEIRADEQSKTEDIHDALAEKMFRRGCDRALYAARKIIADMDYDLSPEAHWLKRADVLAVLDTMRGEL